MLGIKAPLPDDAVLTFGEYWRPKYSLPNKRMVEAVQMLAQTEAILLDPTYTGKSMAGLIGLVRQGYFRKDENLLYIHTGGLPALFAAMPTVLGEESMPD
jgi:D-cysteine desulfhydrase